METILRRWRNNKFIVGQDGRHSNSRRRTFTKRLRNHLVSRAELDRVSTLSLRERARELSNLWGRTISYSTLNRIYREQNIRYKTVDLHCTAKIRRAVEIKQQ